MRRGNAFIKTLGYDQIRIKSLLKTHFKIWQVVEVIIDNTNQGPALILQSSLFPPVMFRRIAIYFVNIVFPIYLVAGVTKLYSYTAG